MTDEDWTCDTFSMRCHQSLLRQQKYFLNQLTVFLIWSLIRKQKYNRLLIKMEYFWTARKRSVNLMSETLTANNGTRVFLCLGDIRRHVDSNVQIRFQVDFHRNDQCTSRCIKPINFDCNTKLDSLLRKVDAKNGQLVSRKMRHYGFHLFSNSYFFLPLHFKTFLIGFDDSKSVGYQFCCHRTIAAQNEVVQMLLSGRVRHSLNIRMYTWANNGGISCTAHIPSQVRKQCVNAPREEQRYLLQNSEVMEAIKKRARA